VRGGLSALCLLGLAGCAATSKPPLQPQAPIVPAANFSVEIVEIVQRPKDDGLAALAIYIDGEEVGRTAPAIRSTTRRWVGTVAPGNRLLGLERWTADRAWQWQKPTGPAQPNERFVRIHKGMRTEVRIRYYDRDKRFKFAITRTPLPNNEASPQAHESPRR
jgi:hypothetical protein